MYLTTNLEDKVMVRYYGNMEQDDDVPLKYLAIVGIGLEFCQKFNIHYKISLADMIFLQKKKKTSLLSVTITAHHQESLFLT